MAPSHSPRQRQAPRSSSGSPYKRGSPSYGLLVPSKHSMLTRTKARYNRSELESPLVPTLGLLSPTLSSTAHILGGINHRRDERVPPSHNIFRPSKDSMHTRTEASIELEPSLVLPSALLPPIASSTDRILDVVHHHCGDMESFADAIKNMVSETHKEIDRCIRQEISTRDSQIEEKRRLAERKTELAKQLDVQMHELKLHHEEKELASREQLENCQAQLRVSIQNMIDSQLEKKNIAAPFALIWPGILTFYPVGICSAQDASVESSSFHSNLWSDVDVLSAGLIYYGSLCHR
ncbi:hypothetical protein GG344DRAFT_81356 [Lentinula edodes]|nr:hypothetical protein GG344DRAFT_81356 [Lentinula edodes]